MSNPYVYVLVRRDLPQSQRAVQASHALLEAARQGLIPHEIEHPHLVLLAVEGPWQLNLDQQYLAANGIRFSVFHEADMNNEATALATEPVYDNQRKVFRRYNLL